MASLSKNGASTGPASAFAEVGLARTVQAVCAEIGELYKSDGTPWVVGYSGGKDSSATLQLVWLAIRELPAAERTKPVHVISTDTLGRAAAGRGLGRYVAGEDERRRRASRGCRFMPHKLTPEVEDSFWVNLIGKGYPAPERSSAGAPSGSRSSRRTSSSATSCRQNGEAILVLGTRKAESQRRAITMEKHEAKRVRERLTPNASLPNSLVYTPIEDWNNDDVWLYLMQVKNPWGHDNKSLLGMYQGATGGGRVPAGRR